MESRRFYTSPINHQNLKAWDAFASTLEQAVRTASPDVLVELGREPVFTYGTDAYDALEAVSRLEVAPRHVRFDLWCAVVMYETLGVTFGSAITANEADAITRRLEQHELAEQTFLRAVDGPYDIDAAQVFGYSFHEGDEESDEQAIEQLLDPFDTPLYIGPRWCILDANEKIDGDAFELFSEVADVVVFIARHDDASKQLWKSSSTGDGLIALFAGDPADQALVDRFGNFEDLRIFLNEQPSAGMRVSLGRCHQDDYLVVVYTPPEEPDIDQPLLFVI